MDHWISTLEKCVLFRGLSRQVLEAEVLPAGRVAEHPRDIVLITYQDRIDWFGVILQGRVQIAQIFSDGVRSLMDTLAPPSVLGADLLPTRSRRAPYFAITSEPTRLLLFPDTLLEEDSPLSPGTRAAVLRQLTTLIAHENMRKHYRIAVLSQKGLRARILTYLTMQAGRRGSGSFTIRFDREELAAFLCVNRSALSHELSLMRQEGLISFHKNHFTLSPALLGEAEPR